MRKNRLEPVGTLGKGGMAEVLRVREAPLHRELAMKVLDAKLAADPGERARFLEEAQVQAQLDHPFVPPVHELGATDDDRPFFTMKRVEGRTLEAILADEGYDPGDQPLLFRTLGVFVKAAQSVAFAHSRGVVHCDLKPANVMVGPFGQVYVMDWGIARLAVDREGSAAGERAVRVDRQAPRVEEPGRVLGTLGYLAPEQARAKHADIDERTDVFALGAILYRMVVGVHIYPTAPRDEAMARAMFAEVTAPERAAPGRKLPKRLCAIALKALALKKADRHQTVEALVDDVEAWLRGDGRHPIRTVAPGEAVVREGEEGHCAFLITRGRCVAFKTPGPQAGGGRQELRAMGPGEVFGETAIFSGGRRTATVEALEETVLVEVDREALEAELGGTFVLAEVVTALASRFREQDARATELGAALERAAVERCVLRYLAMNGEAGPAPGGERAARWTPLRALLEDRLGTPPGEAAARAQSVRGVRVDEAADRVLLAEVHDGPPPPPSSG